MKQPKIVILRGAPATGKTTALHNLRKHKEMKNWVIINNNELKKQFAHLGDKKRKAYGKEALFSICKVLMSQKLNILFDEMSGHAAKRYLKYYIKRYNYKLIVFEFKADLKLAMKREAHRSIVKGKKPRGAEWIKETHKERSRFITLKDSIFIDTTNLNQKQTVDFIIKRLK